MPTSIFVSYAGPDEARVRPLCKALEEQGWSVFWHPRIPAVGNLRDHIGRALADARCVIIAWSKAASESPWVRYEVDVAVRAWARDALVLARLDGTDLPIGLSDLPSIDLSHGDDESIARLVMTVRAVTAPPPPEPQVPTPEARPRSHAPPAAAAMRTLGFGALVVGILVVSVALGLSWLLSARSPQQEAFRPPFSSSVLWLAVGGVVLVLLLRLVQRWWGRKSSRARAGVRIEHVELPGDVPIRPALGLFVSYSSEDAGVVDSVVRQIENAGFTAWNFRNPGGTRGNGGRYAGQIVQAIRTSRAVALMCSCHAFASDHVVREIYVAGDMKKLFVAIQLDDTPFPDDFLYFLSGYPRVPVRELSPERLQTEIGRLLPSKARL